MVEMARVLYRLQTNLNRPKATSLLSFIVAIHCILGVFSHGFFTLSSPVQEGNRQVRSPSVDRHLGGHDGREYFSIYPTQSLSPNEDRMRCVYYNHTECIQSKGENGCGKENQVCEGDSDHERVQDHTYLCFTLWNLEKGDAEISLKGCWLGDEKNCATVDKKKTGACSLPSPEERKKTQKMVFCCCRGPNCNENLHLEQTSIAHSSMQDLPSSDANVSESAAKSSTNNSPKNSSGPTSHSTFLIAFFIIVGIFLVGAIVGAKSLLMAIRQKKRSTEVDAPTIEPLLEDCNSQKPPTGYMGQGPIRLGKVCAEGKFGCVREATDAANNVIAVKVFSDKDQMSWQTERTVFCLPQMKHPNILTFLGAEQHIDDKEFWIITEYHPHGSLFDYLKTHTINLKEFLRIFVGIARGLTHLHDESPPNENEHEKPAIAHRDFKSRNVLLSNNLRPCIADFGLAIVFKQSKLCPDAHGQVGTRRYMAPEVLEGSITFSWDSFTRIDMYAFGLVVWELLSRTNVDAIKADLYQMPFEKELGMYPSIEEMQEFVCQKKNRPEIKEIWERHHILGDVSKTIRDIWDQEPEARLTASNVAERVENLIASIGASDINSDTILDYVEKLGPLRPVQIQPQVQQNQFRVSYKPNIANGQIIAPNNVLSNVHNTGTKGPFFHKNDASEYLKKKI